MSNRRRTAGLRPVVGQRRLDAWLRAGIAQIAAEPGQSVRDRLERAVTLAAMRDQADDLGRIVESPELDAATLAGFARVDLALAELDERGLTGAVADDWLCHAIATEVLRLPWPTPAA
jgi:hypothetical protein